MFLRCGEFSSHIFKDTFEPAIIIATDKNFRVSDTLRHSQEETVHPNACLIKSKCIYCGKEELSWHRNYIEWMKMNDANIDF